MSTAPKISVLTPAYNVSEYIGESIESILSQTSDDFEYVILDDCSEDNTWDIIQNYASNDERIIALKNEKNLGIAGNRNEALKHAQGKYIVWQDSDDISLPQRLEKQSQFLEAHPEVGIIGGFLQFFDKKGLGGIRKYPFDDESIRRNIFKYSPVAQPAAMIRKQCLDEAGEYDLRYPPADDLDMSFRIGQKYKFANLQEIVVHYREHDASATYSKLKHIETKTLELRKKYAQTEHYEMSTSDKIYNYLQASSMHIMPAKLRIGLFNFIRNSKTI